MPRADQIKTILVIQSLRLRCEFFEALKEAVNFDFKLDSFELAAFGQLVLGQNSRHPPAQQCLKTRVFRAMKGKLGALTSDQSSLEFKP